MWLAPGAPEEIRSLTVAMTVRSYEQQLPLDGKVRTAWPQPSAERRLGELDLPTLVVVGAEDLPDLRTICARLAAEIPRARLEVVEGAGHLPSLERPDELNRLLLEFLP
jgi:pimeloyl-ACP methyl ester carboxylesterase